MGDKMKIELKNLEEVAALIEHMQDAEKLRAPNDKASSSTRHFYNGQMASYTYILSMLKSAFVQAE